MSLRGVGVDVADITRFARLLATRGRAFGDRWFTEDEAAECMATAAPAAAFATRYAAKEAVWKALGPGQWAGPLPWRGICVREGPRGSFEVTLTGAAAELAARAGVGVVRVSTVPVSTVRGHRAAIATAVAERAPAGRR